MYETIIDDNYSKMNTRLTRKIGGLLILIGFTAIVLIVESYAWFVGTSSVSTSTFSIGVSTEQNLALSLDGANWATSITLGEANIMGTGSASGASKAYTGHTNHWVGSAGLIPISTTGEIDDDVSRLKLYEKYGITATAGGFRLLASRVDNYSTSGNSAIVSEKDGYVVFDLFIKNGGDGYYVPTYNAADNEAIYLTTSSGVTVTAAGGGNDYGLANSARIAFAQIARISAATTDASTITALSCDSTGSSGTGLCSDVTPTIYEPNNATHNAALVSYFNGICKKKTVSNGVSSYGEACTALTASSAVNTYVVNSAITSSDNVDVYDGLNDFAVTNGYKLTNLTTFTDTQKLLTGVNRPAFMMLAPNSITKIRVYIYLEGQDVDNYDLISLGQSISITFGFTKDQRDLASAGNGGGS